MLTNIGVDWKIYTIPIVGGAVRNITEPPAGTGFDRYAQWSPDGKTLVFQRRDLVAARYDLWKVSTSNPVPTAGAKFFSSPTEDSIDPSYSPDALVVTAAVGPRAQNVPKTAVLESAAPLSSIKAITSNYPSYTFGNTFPILSPDGTRLALMAKNPAISDAASPQLWVARRNMNLPPEFTQIGSHAVADSSTTVSDSPTVGLPFSFTVTASDPEPDAPRYNAYFLREGMAFDTTTRTFSWTPPPLTVGKTFKVKFIVTTESGGTDVVIDKLTVQPCCLLPQSMALEVGATSVGGPNPTSGSFSLATPSLPNVRAELAVFDLGGRRVATVQGRSGSTLVWDGRSNGRLVPNGVYLYRLQVADREKRGRVVVLR
jgi:hypothetical protein